jgi:hypothetical protein
MFLFSLFFWLLVFSCISHRNARNVTAASVEGSVAAKVSVSLQVKYKLLISTCRKNNFAQGIAIDLGYSLARWIVLNYVVMFMLVCIDSMPGRTKAVDK